MKYTVHTPIGLEPLVSKIEDICFNAPIYNRCGVSPQHYLINLDPGNGHTTVASYVSDAFRTFGIRHFGSQDLYLEYTLDGTMDQLKQVLSSIRYSGDYTNEYEGVVAMDITALAAHLNETQLSVFLKELPVIGQHATLVLFIPAKTGKNIAQLVEKVSVVLGDELDIVNVEAYTEDNLVDIVKEFIDETGVALEEDADIDDCILSAVRRTEASTVKDAKRLAHTMVKKANFDSFIPTLNSRSISSAFDLNAAKEAV